MQVASSYSETKSIQNKTTGRGRYPLRMLGLEGVSKRSLSESKKKSEEPDKLAKFHIFIQFIQWHSKG